MPKLWQRSKHASQRISQSIQEPWKKLAQDRVQRDIERQLQRVPPEAREWLDELLGRTRRILQQRPKDKNKLYALHARKSSASARARRACATSSASRCRS